VLVSSAAAALLVASCASSPTTGGGGAGSDGGNTVPADAFVMATVSPAQGQTCPYPPNTQTLLGQPAMARPATVQDGATLPGGRAATIQCVVKRLTGDEFQVVLGASVRGPMGGSFSVFSQGGGPIFSASDGAQAVVAAFGGQANDDFAWYASHPCGLTFTYLGKPVPDYPPIVPGRIWGHVSCPTAEPAPSGSDECDLEVDFLFENCAE